MSVKRNLKILEDAISKGALVNADSKKKKRVQINLHIPEEILEQIDSKVDDRIVISRTAWILEAIVEKLNK